MKKTNATARNHETKLPHHLVKAWLDTVMQTARLKGFDRSSPDRDKLQQILRQEHQSVLKLWEAFTTDRDQLPRYLLDPKKQTTAYLLGFHLPNAARIWSLLTRLSQRYDIDKLISGRVLNISDLGCGTGSMGQSLASFLKLKDPKATVDISIIDQQGAFLDATRLGYKNLNFTGNIRSKRAALEQSFPTIRQGMKDDQLNIILLGYVWNELSRNPKAQKGLIDLISQQSGKDTIILLMEPANQYLSRAAMELRDQLLATGFQSIYPCLHSKPCPMLERTKDWCYSETSWDLPPLMKKLDSLIRINRERLRYSGHALVSPSVKEKLMPRFPEKAFPVVGLPTQKGKDPSKFEYLVCKDDGLENYPRQTTAKKLMRGSLLFTKPLPSQKS